MLLRKPFNEQMIHEFIQIYAIEIKQEFELSKDLWSQPLLQQRIEKFLASHQFMRSNKAKYNMQFKHPQFAQEIILSPHFMKFSLKASDNNDKFMEEVLALFYPGIEKKQFIKFQSVEYKQYFSKASYRAYLQKTKHLVFEEIERLMKKRRIGQALADVDVSSCRLTALIPFNKEVESIYWEFVEECKQVYINNQNK